LHAPSAQGEVLSHLHSQIGHVLHDAGTAIDEPRLTGDEAARF
jgi:hypothetical protein